MTGHLPARSHCLLSAETNWLRAPGAAYLAAFAVDLEVPRYRNSYSDGGCSIASSSGSIEAARLDSTWMSLCPRWL